MQVENTHVSTKSPLRCADPDRTTAVSTQPPACGLLLSWLVWFQESEYPQKKPEKQKNRKQKPRRAKLSPSLAEQVISWWTIIGLGPTWGPEVFCAHETPCGPHSYLAPVAFCLRVEVLCPYGLPMFNVSSLLFFYVVSEHRWDKGVGEAVCCSPSPYLVQVHLCHCGSLIHISKTGQSHAQGL